MTKLTQDDISLLNRQFTQVLPLVGLGIALSNSLRCTSCMDNTDGTGNTLEELSIASNKSFIVEEGKINIPNIVYKIADSVSENPIKMAFGAGADFSLIGTIKKPQDMGEIEALYGPDFQIIGHVGNGKGVYLEEKDKSFVPLQFSRWNYFSNDMKINGDNTN